VPLYYQHINKVEICASLTCYQSTLTFITICRSKKITGLTTATAIWVSAAIGVASGAGLHLLTVFGALITVTVLRIGRLRKELSQKLRQYAAAREANRQKALMEAKIRAAAALSASAMKKGVTPQELQMVVNRPMAMGTPEGKAAAAVALAAAAAAASVRAPATNSKSAPSSPPVAAAPASSPPPPPPSPTSTSPSTTQPPSSSTPAVVAAAPAKPKPKVVVPPIQKQQQEEVSNPAPKKKKSSSSSSSSTQQQQQNQEGQALSKMVASGMVPMIATELIVETPTSVERAGGGGGGSSSNNGAGAGASGAKPVVTAPPPKVEVSAESSSTV